MADPRDRDSLRGAAGGTRSTYGGNGAGDFGGEHYRPERSGEGSGGSDYRGGAPTGREQSGTSHFDENYRLWRASQKSRGGGAPDTPEAPGSDFAGEETAGGGGEGSALNSSTGSSPPPAADDEGGLARR